MTSCPPSGDPSDPAYLARSLVAMVPSAKANAAFYLRDSARDFFRRSEVWRDQRVSAVVPAGASEITMPAPPMGKVDSVVAIWALLPRGEYKLMRHETQYDEPPDESIIGRERLTALPRWYSPTRSMVIFHRAWIDACALRLHVILVPSADSTIGNAELIDEYQDTILAGAAYRAHRADGSKAESLQMAREYQADFARGVSEARLKYKRTFGTERPETGRSISERGLFGSLARPMEPTPRW